MSTFSRVLVVVGLSYAAIEARREASVAEATLAEIHMHQEAFEDHIEELNEEGCARSCHIMNPDVFWQYASDPDALRAKADENCVSPKCKGCRRSRRAGQATTMPDCRKPEPEVAEVSAKTAEPAPVAQDDADEEPIKASDPCLDNVPEGMVCDWQNTAWCIAPAIGKASCRKGGKPFCCSKLAEVAAPVAKETAEDAVVEVEESAPVAKKTAEDAVVEVEKSGDVCADGEFVFKTIKNREVCRNTETGRFAKKICCNQAQKAALAEKEAAMDACANDVKETHCRGGRFEKKRKKYKTVPASYTCDTRYVCKSKSRGEELVGPVSSVAECGKMSLTAFKTCVAIKK
eukprot:TRINITY_DN10999_c1_g1_i1.p1 TRINITY_DN10999_c1_g1~~TRINITY_DN10999_c1_g1_i1.p1  ORF type:complete len:346 (-),score=106.23 TRINITY_DN10999_c1_g1_i1:339-1376(-)